MRHLKFEMVVKFDSVSAPLIVNAVFVPGSQTLNLHREGLRSTTDQAFDFGYDAWTDRTVLDLIGRIYGAFRSIPVYHNGVSPLPVF